MLLTTMELNQNDNKVSRKFSNVWKLNNKLLNNSWFFEKFNKINKFIARNRENANYQYQIQKQEYCYRNCIHQNYKWNIMNSVITTHLTTYGMDKFLETQFRKLTQETIKKSDQ